MVELAKKYRVCSPYNGPDLGFMINQVTPCFNGNQFYLILPYFLSRRLVCQILIGISTSTIFSILINSYIGMLAFKASSETVIAYGISS